MHFVSTFSLSAACFFIFLLINHRACGYFFPGTFSEGPFCYVHATYHFLKWPWMQVPLGQGPGSESPLSVQGTLLVTPPDLPHVNLRIVPCGVFCYCLSLGMCWTIIIKDVLLWSSLSSKSSISCWLASRCLLGSQVGGAGGRWAGGGRAGPAAAGWACCAICCSTASALNLAESIGSRRRGWFQVAVFSFPEPGVSNSQAPAPTGTPPQRTLFQRCEAIPQASSVSSLPCPASPLPLNCS